MITTKNITEYKKVFDFLSYCTKQRKLLWKYKKTKKDYVYTTKIKNYKIIYEKIDSYSYNYSDSETLTIKNTLSGKIEIIRNEGNVSEILNSIISQKEETKEEMIENILEILK